MISVGNFLFDTKRGNQIDKKKEKQMPNKSSIVVELIKKSGDKNGYWLDVIL